MGILLLTMQSQAKILILAPHPDDDIIMASGIVSRAVLRGEDVRIVYMTNGDYYNFTYNGTAYNGVQVGYVREGEAVLGQSHINVPENKLIFLGYPDGYLQEIYNDYPNSGNQLVTPNNNVSATYGNRGLGSMDYHMYRFGSHGAYNTANIVADLSDIISSFRPDHIFVTSGFDATTDHATTYQFLKQAAVSVCNNNPGYNPVIHQFIVWWDAQYWWPNMPIVWPNSPDPTAPLAEIPDVARTGLTWGTRESFTVPLNMQLPNYSDNPKALGLNEHLIGQKGAYGYIGFIGLHKDEVFWPEAVVGSSQPPIVNAGTDQTVIQGATVTLNGTQSFSPDAKHLTYKWRQVSGTQVHLSDSTNVSPSFQAPAGLAQNQTLSFELVISDGVFTTVPTAVSVNVIIAPSTDTNIAPLATVTASSQDVQDAQGAAKAVDGVVDGFLGDGSLQVDGYPGDGTREWSSIQEKSGAWLTLTWPRAYSIDRIVLHDRINLADNLTSGTITFSDGSSIVVGPLNNNGTSTVYSFPARSVTSLTLTVTGVSSATFAIGLAEIEVYGIPGTIQTQYSCIRGRRSFRQRFNYRQPEQIELCLWRSGDAVGHAQCRIPLQQLERRSKRVGKSPDRNRNRKYYHNGEFWFNCRGVIGDPVHNVKRIRFPGRVPLRPQA